MPVVSKGMSFTMGEPSTLQAMSDHSTPSSVRERMASAHDQTPGLASSGEEHGFSQCAQFLPFQLWPQSLESKHRNHSD